MNGPHPRPLGGLRSLPVPIESMNQRTRKQLVQVACIAAWADLEIAAEEMEVIRGLATRLELSDSDKQVVEAWLKSPPPEIDPYDIPHKHRKAFLQVFREVVEADGRIDLEESETIQLLSELLA